MKVSDIINLCESDDWKKQRDANEKAAVISAIESAKSLEDFKSFITWGNFRVKPLPGDDYHSDYTTRVKEFLDENIDVKELLIKKVSSLVTGEDEIVDFVKSFYGSGIFSLIVDNDKKRFAKFFADSLTVANGEIVFKQEKIKSHTLAREILQTLIEHDVSLLISALKQAVSQIPNATIKFVFDGSATSSAWDGRGAIQVSEKNFVTQLYHAALIAFEIDEYDSSIEAKRIITSSPQYRRFAKSLSAAVNKMTTITEVDVYTDEYSFFLNRHHFSDFIRALLHFICLLENAREVGRNVFAWYYNLPRHGAVHHEKQSFLSVYSEILSRSDLMNFTKAECIFDNGEKLAELSYFE